MDELNQVLELYITMVKCNTKQIASILSGMNIRNVID